MISPIEIPQRTDYEIEIEVVDERGKPVSVTGSTGRFVISAGVDGEPLSVISGSAIEMTDPAGGIVTVKLDDTETDLRGKHYFEFELLGPAGNRSVGVNGVIDFKPTNQGY